MIIESVRIVVQPVKHEELRRGLASLVGPTEVQKGCVSCRLLVEVANQHAFCYEAQWKTLDDLLHHLRSDQYRRLLVFMDLGQEAPQIEFHTVAETRGLDFVRAARSDS